MGIYDNETKVYPDLNPTAPHEPQRYRLQKLTEIETYLLNEIEDREREAKKMKRFKTIISIPGGTDLITSKVITGGTSIATSSSGIDLPVGIIFCGASIFFSLMTVATEIFQNPHCKARKTQYH